MGWGVGSRLTHAPVHVGKFDLVVVEEEQLPDPAPRQHLGGHAPDTADPDHGHRVVADGLVKREGP